jgi:intracellular septation protein A
MVLGGAALVTGDPRFVMIKPTVAYLTIGAAMLQPGWMDRYMPPASKDYLPRRLIVAGGYVWSGLMFATAALNLVIALTMGHKAWLVFIGIFPLASKLGLFAVHYASFRFIALRNQRAQEAMAAEAQPA